MSQAPVRRFAVSLVAGLLTLTGVGQAAEPAVPSDSIYLLTDTYIDARAQKFTLRQRRGKPQLVGMFYTSCAAVCPLLIEATSALLARLEPGQRNQVQVLFVSFDPKRDTPKALSEVVTAHKLPPAQWTLAVSNAAAVRRLAAALDIRYRALSDGEFNHTSALILLDAQGRVLARTERLSSSPDAAFLAMVRSTLSGK